MADCKPRFRTLCRDFVGSSDIKMKGQPEWAALDGGLSFR